MPVADRVLPIVRVCARAAEPDDLLCVTASGHRLHATALKRTLAWTTIADGRRIHDLRHTAACLWLARGVDPVTVQAWMGHASIATTNLYLHHLGTAADRAGLERSEPSRGHTGGTRGRGRVRITRCVSRRGSVGRRTLSEPAFEMVELRGLEPLTFSLRTRRATDCAIAPWTGGMISTQTLPPSGGGRLRCFPGSGRPN